MAVQLCDGATPEEAELWRLQPANTFKYLNRSSCYTLPRVDNGEEYRVRRSGSSPAAAHREVGGAGGLPPVEVPVKLSTALSVKLQVELLRGQPPLCCSICSVQTKRAVASGSQPAAGAGARRGWARRAQATRRSMTLVGIPAEQQEAVFRMVAAVLHLGNLAFQEAGDQDTSTIQVPAPPPAAACRQVHILQERAGSPASF